MLIHCVLCSSDVYASGTVSAPFRTRREKSSVDALDVKVDCVYAQPLCTYATSAGLVVCADCLDAAG